MASPGMGRQEGLDNGAGNGYLLNYVQNSSEVSVWKLSTSHTSDISLWEGAPAFLSMYMI